MVFLEFTTQMTAKIFYYLMDISLMVVKVGFAFTDSSADLTNYFFNIMDFINMVSKVIWIFKFFATLFTMTNTNSMYS